MVALPDKCHLLGMGVVTFSVGRGKVHWRPTIGFKLHYGQGVALQPISLEKIQARLKQWLRDV
jgi:hypothetical protein